MQSPAWRGLFFSLRYGSLKVVDFPAVDGYLAPQAGNASVGWAPGSAPSALDSRLSPQSTAISLGSLGGGRRRKATLRRRGFDFCRHHLCLSGLSLSFVGRR